MHDAPAGTPATGTTYRIRIKGEVDSRWSSWFDGLRIAADGAGDTELTGTLRDQAALHGVLARVRDLGLTLLSVEPGSNAQANPSVATAVPVTPAAPRAGLIRRSPVAAIGGSIVAGLGLALAFILGPASGGSEATITGALLLAFGLGWGLMGLATTRFSSQPQRWMRVPAAILGITGAALVVTQPTAGTMDLLAWIWPPALGGLAIWMLLRARRDLHGRGRWLVVPLIATLLAAAVGGAAATIGGVVARGAAPATGRLIEVDGHRLFLDCHGTGAPVVVLQAGLGGTAADWSRIVPTVAGITTVCAYDRAGHGWSDAAPEPQDGNAIAADLHALLARAGLDGPFVLAGHSSGGPYQEVFAARYPDAVAGMVLLDAQPTDAFTALPDYPGFYDAYTIALALAPSLARAGLMGPLLGSVADPSGVRTGAAMRDEIRVLPEALRQAQALRTLGDRPLVVVTAGSGQQAGWMAAQARLLDLSTDGIQHLVPAATHDSLVLGADAEVSAEAIVEIVRAVRTGEPLR